MKDRVYRVKDKLWVQHKGRIYALPASLKKSGHAAEEEESALVAPFSCKVLKVHVEAGAKVKKGELLVVVEAMKMEYSYYAPRDGEIAEVLARTGAIFPQGESFVRWKD